MLARVIKSIRPEVDLYLLDDCRPEDVVSDPAASGLRRVFYEVEEPLEIHLAILEGVDERYRTPYFDNLKKYAQKPIGTFHALPIARGKSVFRSDWIRDMGEFYGPTLFLAESSATTGGLDSLLEPTGNIKLAQDAAARAFGADKVFFVTNGTSTSNKMVYQALCQPGDIVIVDRNCHKSHHYGCVLAGAQPYYVEAFPLTAYSMYGSVPLRTIKKALLDLKAAGRLDQVRMIALTNVHLRRPHVRHPARHGGVPGDQAGPRVHVGRGVVRLRRGSTGCTAGARPWARASSSQEWFADPRSLEAYLEQAEDLRRGPRSRRIRGCSTRASCPTRGSRGSASTRRTRPTSRCRRCARARWCWWGTRTSTTTRRRSTRPCSRTRRRRRTCRSSPRSTSRAARWSSRATSW